MKLLVSLLFVVVAVSGQNLISSVVKGVSSLGTGVSKQVAKTASDAVITGATAVKDTSMVTTSIGKAAIVGAGAVTSNLLNNTGNVANDAIGVIDIVGDNLGTLGIPLKDIGTVGKNTVKIGLDVANKGIGALEQVGDKTLTVINKVVEGGSGTVINASKAGNNFFSDLMNILNETVDNLLKG